MAARRGCSFCEFLGYALLAPPLAFIAAKSCSPATEETDADKAPARGTPAAVTAMRFTTAAAVLGTGALVAYAPGHTLSRMERTAQIANDFDECVVQAGMPGCLPGTPIVLINDAVAATLTEYSEYFGDSDFGETDTPAYRAASVAPAVPVAETKTAPRAAAKPSVKQAAPPAPAPRAKGAPMDITVAKAVPATRAPETEAKAEPAEEDTPREPASPASFTRAQVRAAQIYLTALGYEPGPVDGFFGDRTANAISAFETDHGMPVSGVMSLALLDALDEGMNRGIAHTRRARPEEPGERTPVVAETEPESVTTPATDEPAQKRPAPGAPLALSSL